MITYRKATENDLEDIWNMNISDNPEDDRWVRWKEQYIGYNRSGAAVTFVILDGNIPVGEVTLILSPDCKAVNGRACLADGRQVGNVNALRIRSEYEGKGYVSGLMRFVEGYATEIGIRKLTIGVEANEARNLGIYLHWGYTEFICSETANGELILYYGKNI